MKGLKAAQLFVVALCLINLIAAIGIGMLGEYSALHGVLGWSGALAGWVHIYVYVREV